jgi:hypothetical protein
MRRRLDRSIDNRDDEVDPRLRDDRPDPRGDDGPPFNEGKDEQEDDADGEPYLRRQPDGRMVIARTRRRCR